MKRTFRRGAIFLAAVAAVLLVFSGCATVRTTSHAYDTGDVLDPGQMRFTSDSVMFLWVPLPGQIAVSRGFEGGWEATAGWGVHGFDGREETAEEDDTLHGPELYATKRLLSVEDWLQVSGTLGTDINVVPQVDALIQGRLTVGWHPADWFTIYANGGAAYVTASGQFAPIVGLGLGLDGRFVLKVAAYLTPDQTESQREVDVLWPWYYGLQIGFKTKGAAE